MTYGELNLKELRDKCGLDFAHYTYKRNQCSCCYGPRDMAKRYWKDGIIKDAPYTFILFKNANNGSGVVTRNDEIKDVQYIEWYCNSPEQLVSVCKELQMQLGNGYIVYVPKNKNQCILVLRAQKEYPEYVAKVAEEYTPLMLKLK